MSTIDFALTSLPECFVYKLGPRPSAKGYMCRDWKPEDHIWTGKVTVLSHGDQCIVRLEDPISGEIFANSTVTESGPNAIERALDSSRYFIIRVEAADGRYAHFGMGFETREDAFDFVHTIEQHFRRVREDKELKANPASQKPPTDYSLKEGQKITVNLKLKPTKKSTTVDHSAPLSLDLTPPSEDVAPPRRTHATASTPSSAGIFAATGVQSKPAAPAQAPPASASASFFSFPSTSPSQVTPPPAAQPAAQPSSSAQLLSFFSAPPPAAQPAPAAAPATAPAAAPAASPSSSFSSFFFQPPAASPGTAAGSPPASAAPAPAAQANVWASFGSPANTQPRPAENSPFAFGSTAPAPAQQSAAQQKKDDDLFDFKW